MNKQVAYGAIIVAISALGWFVFRPICVPIADDDLKNFTPPIDQRTDERGMIYHFWQQKDGHWNQCKSAIEREFFF